MNWRRCILFHSKSYILSNLTCSKSKFNCATSHPPLIDTNTKFANLVLIFYASQWLVQVKTPKPKHVVIFYYYRYAFIVIDLFWDKTKTNNKANTLLLLLSLSLVAFQVFLQKMFIPGNYFCD